MAISDLEDKAVAILQDVLDRKRHFDNSEVQGAIEVMKIVDKNKLIDKRRDKSGFCYDF